MNFLPIVTSVGNQTSAAVTPQNSAHRPYMALQAEYPASVTGNVIFEGRISPAYSYQILHTFTVSGIFVTDWMPDVRVRTTSITGGVATVSAGLA